MKPTTEIWELNRLVQSYFKRRFEIVEEHGQAKEVEDEMEQEKATFNKYGFLVSRKQFDDDLIFQYKWNEDKLHLKNFTTNDFVQVLLFNSDDKSYCGEHTFKFNKKGELIQENNYNLYGDLNAYTHYDNNDWGRPEVVTKYRDNEISMIENYEYDLKGKVVKSKITFPSDPNLSCTKQIIYDNEGNVKEEKYFDPFLLPKYLYQYSYLKDSNGNWIKRFVYQDGKLKWYETREIKYFVDELF